MEVIQHDDAELLYIQYYRITRNGHLCLDDRATSTLIVYIIISAKPHYRLTSTLGFGEVRYGAESGGSTSIYS